MNGEAAQSLWEFSLALYARPGVEAACLDLQDRLGLDVNLLMFACWAASRGHGRIGRGDWQRLLAASAAWRADVVEPLRAVRRGMKGAAWPGVPDADAASLRRQVKDLELTAERIQQTALASLVRLRPRESREHGRAAALANLEGFAAAVGVEVGADDRAGLERLAEAAEAMMRTAAPTAPLPPKN